jgi:hypothetical protein
VPQFTVNPLTNPGKFDVLIAAGVQSAGVARLMSGGGREYNWDIKQAPGVQGYTMTYRGWKVGEDIVFRFEFFEHPDGPGYATAASQIESFYANWIPLWALDARKVQKPNPIVVQHPALSANDIQALVCKKIGPLETDGQMRWWVDMTFLEHRPPKLIQSATPSGATDRLGIPKPLTKTQQAIIAEQELAARPRG